AGGGTNLGCSRDERHHDGCPHPRRARPSCHRPSAGPGNCKTDVPTSMSVLPIGPNGERPAFTNSHPTSPTLSTWLERRHRPGEVRVALHQIAQRELPSVGDAVDIKTRA